MTGTGQLQGRHWLGRGPQDIVGRGRQGHRKGSIAGHRSINVVKKTNVYDDIISVRCYHITKNDNFERMLKFNNTW